MSISTLKTGMLLAFMTVIMVGMGALAGGQTGMVIAFVIALATNAFSYWNAEFHRFAHARSPGGRRTFSPRILPHGR